MSTMESEVVSGFVFQDTELKLGLPGGGGGFVRPAGLDCSDRKRGFSQTVELTLGSNKDSSSSSADDDCSVESLESKVSGHGKPSAAKAQVVGWPPVRSFRKNALKTCKYVKVAVDGAPYLRKVDLETYNGYQQLLTALEEMFSCFTIRNSPEERRLVDQVNGMEYVPTYEDKEGDWMLVGDVPWNSKNTVMQSEGASGQDHFNVQSGMELSYHFIMTSVETREHLSIVREFRK